MKRIVIYTGNLCGYCAMAKKLLNEKNIDFDEINIHEEHNKIDEMIKLTGGRKSVPQIFYGTLHIGGCDDLYSMNSNGELDKILNKEIG